MRTLMHTHNHQHDVCLNLGIVGDDFPWYQLLLVESNWIGCNWLWSAGLNSKCWLCINIQIKSLFILCVYVRTDVWWCIDCKRRPWADFTCVAKKKKKRQRKSDSLVTLVVRRKSEGCGTKEWEMELWGQWSKEEKEDAARSQRMKIEKNIPRLPPDLLCVFACVTRCFCCFTSGHLAATENRLLLFLERVRPCR